MCFAPKYYVRSLKFRSRAAKPAAEFQSILKFKALKIPRRREIYGRRG